MCVYVNFFVFLLFCLYYPIKFFKRYFIYLIYFFFICLFVSDDKSQETVWICMGWRNGEDLGWFGERKSIIIIYVIEKSIFNNEECNIDNESLGAR